MEYFSNLFKCDGCHTADILRCVDTRVTSERNSLLLAQFSAIKVKEALFEMHSDKSPSLDVMKPAFYEKI